MDPRTLQVRKDRRGCTLYDGERPLAWYPSMARALAMAQLLADAGELRAGHAPPILLRSCRPPPSGQANGGLPRQC